jgi:hypothetical protein
VLQVGLRLVFQVVLGRILPKKPPCAFAHSVSCLFTDPQLMLDGRTGATLHCLFGFFLEGLVLKGLVNSSVCSVSCFFIVFVFDVEVFCFLGFFFLGFGPPEAK